MTAETRLPGAVPCSDRENHRPEFPAACSQCRGVVLAPVGGTVLVVRTQWTCPRGHRGQLDGFPCTVCVGESKNPGPVRTEPTPTRRHRSGICEHGLKARRRSDGLPTCQFCRRSTTPTRTEGAR